MNGEYRDALEAFEAWRDEDPESAQAHYYVGICRLFLSETQPAVDSLEEAIRLGAPFPEAYYWLSRALGQSGDVKTALDVLARGLERFPENRKLLALNKELASPMQK